MTSPAQIAANQKNATRSTGPKTDAGKLTVSQNALRHGCTAAHVVLAHESIIDFECILIQYQRDYKPANTHELFLVETMAQARWRIARLRRFETAAFDLLLGAADPEAPDSILAQSLSGKDGDPLAKIERYASSAERTYYKAQRQLAEAQKARAKAITEQSQFTPEPTESLAGETMPELADLPLDDEEFMAYMDRFTAPPSQIQAPSFATSPKTASEGIGTQTGVLTSCPNA